MAKKYYWLKLKTDFFNSKEIKKLRKTAGGDTFVIIYLKMQLLSLKNDGKLYYDGVDDDFASEIALTLDEDIENVRLTIAFLQHCGLIECISEEEYFMSQVPELTGKESDSAARMRKMRASHCDIDVTNTELQCNNFVTLEKEKETETEKEKETDLEKEELPKESAIERDFEECWKIYPKKQGKQKAFSAYKKSANASKNPDFKEIVLKGIQNYINYINANKIQDQYIKQGATYFCNECWNDEYNSIAKGTEPYGKINKGIVLE